MTPQPTALNSPGDREFDEILSRAPLNAVHASNNGSQDEFLPSSRGIVHSPAALKRVREPIPANRAALIREIEDENLRQRQKASLRQLGYLTLLVLAVVVTIILLGIAGWLLWIAWSDRTFGLQPLVGLPKEQRIMRSIDSQKLREEWESLAAPHETDRNNWSQNARSHIFNIPKEQPSQHKIAIPKRHLVREPLA